LIAGELQDFKVPQLRGEYQKTGFFRTLGEQVTGYGFIHDGSTDTLFSFLHANVFFFQTIISDVTLSSSCSLSTPDCGPQLGCSNS